eukprot:6357507-Pyramimonas_sp.AAC.1
MHTAPTRRPSRVLCLRRLCKWPSESTLQAIGCMPLTDCAAACRRRARESPRLLHTDCAAACRRRAREPPSAVQAEDLPGGAGGYCILTVPLPVAAGHENLRLLYKLKISQVEQEAAYDAGISRAQFAGKVWENLTTSVPPFARAMPLFGGAAPPDPDTDTVELAVRTLSSHLLTRKFGSPVQLFSHGEEKGTPAGVVNRARGPALGCWEDRPPAAYDTDDVRTRSRNTGRLRKARVGVSPALAALAARVSGTTDLVRKTKGLAREALQARHGHRRMDRYDPAKPPWHWRIRLSHPFCTGGVCWCRALATPTAADTRASQAPQGSCRRRRRRPFRREGPGTASMRARWRAPPPPYGASARAAYENNRQIRHILKWTTSDRGPKLGGENEPVFHSVMFAYP